MSSSRQSEVRKLPGKVDYGNPLVTVAFARAGGDVTIETSLPLTGSLAPFGPTLGMGFQRAAPAGEPGRGPHPSPS